MVSSLIFPISSLSVPVKYFDRVLYSLHWADTSNLKRAFTEGQVPDWLEPTI